MLGRLDDTEHMIVLLLSMQGSSAVTPVDGAKPADAAYLSSCGPPNLDSPSTVTLPMVAAHHKIKLVTACRPLYTSVPVEHGANSSYQ